MYVNLHENVPGKERRREYTMYKIKVWSVYKENCPKNIARKN